MPALRTLFKVSLTALSFAAASVGTTVQAQTITAVMHAPLRAVDPVISTAYILRNYGYMVYDTLLARDAQGVAQPQMASWRVSDDGKTYTFTLREGLKWHDGSPVTAQDCIASIQRWSQVDKMGQIMASLLSDMHEIDANSFAMTFKAPTDIAIRALSKPSGVAAFMMPKAVAQTPSGQAITSTVGSGPFKFNAEQYRPGVQAVFVKNTDYVPRSEPSSGLAGAKVVNVDAVKWVTMPDPMTAVNALLSGEVDFIEQTPHDLLPLVENTPGIRTTVFKKQGNQNVVRLNFLYPPFDNLQIRQAALLALGQQPLLDAQIGHNSPYARTCPSAFGCNSANASDYAADKITVAQPEKAKALLKEAGYDNTPVVLLHGTDLLNVAPMGPVFAQQLREAGFNVQMISMDWASVVARRASKAPPSAGGWNIFSTYNVLPDVENPLGFVAVAAGGDSAWFGWPNVPAIEQAREKLALASSPEEAKALDQDIQRLAIDNVVLIPMGEFDNVTTSSTKLSGQVDAEAPVFWNVTKSGK